MTRLAIITFFLIFISLPGKAQTEDAITEDILIEIDELIVDETISKAGRDFYEIFFTQWVWPKTDESFTIYIKERPARANSTQVQIFVNDLLVFESFLQPKYEDLILLSNYTTSLLRNHILTYEDVLQQLQGADMSGTGIY
ncbi:MAG: hypothetical protein HKN48_09095 [Flavobacteriaceae bacterium]|nr:hypothetical protein [Flavobacteriaceae bacterium]